MMKRFEGTDTYIAMDDLMMAVNAALTLERPLYEWHIKSTTNAQHGLYEYDAASRLRDELLKLDGDQGARAVLERHRDAVRLLECDDPGILFDVDRKSDLAAK